MNPAPAPATTTLLFPLTEDLLLSALPEPIEQAPPLLVEAARQAEWPGRFIVSSMYGFATVDDKQVRAVGGIVPQWPGRGIAWLLLAPAATARHAVEATHTLRDFMDHAQTDPKRWNRIETVLRADLPWCDRFAEITAMSCEGTLRAFDSLGRDYRLFARLAGFIAEQKRIIH